jgi:ribosome-associated protein
LTTRRGGHDGGSSERGRPRIKSSHERVLDGSVKSKGKTKKARGAPRAALAPQHTLAPPRARGPKKTRPAQDLALAERTGAWSVASESARSTASAIAIAALDKKAVGLEILDVAGKVDYADFLVVMTGRSDRHALALAQGIEEALRKQGIRPVAVEGLPHGTWVLMDFGDVVVHVFQDDARRVYDIEGLWLDAQRLPVPSEPVTE